MAKSRAEAGVKFEREVYVGFCGDGNKKYAKVDLCATMKTALSVSRWMRVSMHTMEFLVILLV